jgi:hypothetical protein
VSGGGARRRCLGPCFMLTDKRTAGTSGRHRGHFPVDEEEVVAFSEPAVPRLLSMHEHASAARLRSILGMPVGSSAGRGSG